MNVEETKLPGIGLRHDFLTGAGRRIGVVSTKTGARHLVVYDAQDQDAVEVSVELSSAESQVLAELLGAPRLIERLAKLREQVEGLTTSGIPLSADAPYVGRPMGDAAIRTRTGVSIVAVFRDDRVHPSPGPEFVLQQGDKLIVVGTEEGVREAAAILDPS
ncbi:MAG TPA: TrkA C-terminal domain-containing protein [Nocardioides sp.]|uniref:cation:proton antiporter regulatory subunit n=1 Tax=Nocardioides sp. TaxID=35761 RepID=UPI002ED9D6F9